MDTNKTRSGFAQHELLLAKEAYAIVGAAMEVHGVLGAGFLEPVYQEAMEFELASRGVPFEPQKVLQISYKQHVLCKQYIADLVCYGQVLVELKALKELTSREEAQMLNYLKATKLRLGILINFGDPARLDWQRIIV
jgi:GxxExxY protein